MPQSSPHRAPAQPSPPGGWGLRAKLALLVVVVAVVPTVVLALTLLDVHDRVLRSTADELGRRAAEDAAGRTAADIHAVVRTVELLAVDTIQWAPLSARERAGALWLLYGHSNDIAAVALAEGPGVAPATVFLDESVSRAKGRVSPDPLLLDWFRQDAKAKSLEVQVGGALFNQHAAAAIVPMSVTLPLGSAQRDVSSEAGQAELRLGLSLRSICERIAERQGGSIQLSLSDASGRRLCPDAGGGVGTEIPEAESEAIRRGADSPADSDDSFIASADVDFGWHVVATQPASAAYATSVWMRQRTIFWGGASLVAALAAGLFLARSISGPVAKLVAATVELGRGNLDHRVDVRGGEFGHLADAFNRMGHELQQRHDEHRAWNDELQTRVEIRSRDLAAAHEQVVQSQRMVALHTLSAGIAHEINNPLTGVVTLTEVLLEEIHADPTREDLAEPLTEVVQNGYRIRDIVRRLSQLGAEQIHNQLERVDVVGVLGSALCLVASRREGRSVALVEEYDETDHTIVGQPDELRQAFVEVLTNAIDSMADGGRMSVAVTRLGDGGNRVTIEDTGRGIAGGRLAQIFDPFHTSKDAWSSQGLGLAIVKRIVDNHHGRVSARSEVGRGTCVTIDLPAEPLSAPEAPRHAAHLLGHAPC